MVGSRWSRLVDVAAAVVLVAALPPSLLAGVDGPGGTSTTGPVVLLAVLALLAGVRALQVVALRRRNSRLLLHREGVEASGPDGRGTFGWSLFTGVRTGPGPHRLVLVAHDGTTVGLPAVELRSDPQLVARLLEHYRVHDEDRGELADGRVLARVAQDRLAAWTSD